MILSSPVSQLSFTMQFCVRNLLSSSLLFLSILELKRFYYFVSSTERRSPTICRQPSTSFSGTSCLPNPTFRSKTSLRTVRTTFRTCRWLTTTFRTWTTRSASFVDRGKSIRASAFCSLKSRSKLKQKRRKKSGSNSN